MKRLVTFPSKYGETIIEIDEPVPTGGEVRVARPGVVERASEEFETALQRIQPAVKVITETLHDLNNPEEITVEFGIKLSATAGAFIASADAESNFTVTVLWKNPNLRPQDEQQDQ
jgi:hypothetical protein